MGIFIAVAAVLVLLNLFFVFIIRALGARLGNFAQNNMLRQSSVFDELILRKEETLQGLISSIEHAELRYQDLTDIKETQADYGVPLEHHAVTPGNYMNPDFSHDYKQIRENFIYNKEDLVQKLAKYLKDEPEDVSVSAARKILDSVDADSRYLLSTLSPEEQYDTLQSVFDETQMDLLKEYAKQHSTFESFEFMAWLNDIIFMNSNDIIVRTSLKSDNFDKVDKRIRTEYDDALVEGLYVIHKGKMYDYSIRGKEISG